jgi:hypothetical protein
VSRQQSLGQLGQCGGFVVVVMGLVLDVDVDVDVLVVKVVADGVGG